MVLNLAEAVFGGDAVGPAFDSGPLNLDGAAAVPTDQMVVMAHRASPVGRLAVVSADQVDLVGVGHHLEGAVDGGQSDVLPLLAEVMVYLASGAEVVRP